MACLSIDYLNNGEVVIKEFVEFNPSKKQEYLNLFQDKITQGIIKQGHSFYDDRWVLIIGGKEYSTTFMNDIELQKSANLFNVSTSDFQLAYRSFVLYSLYKAKTVMNFVRGFKYFLNTGKLYKGQYSVTKTIIEFLEYITVPEQNISKFEIISEMERSDINSESANIPSFENIFLITDIANDILENKNMMDYKEHLLFIMWWRVCSILPLRPSEFLETKYNCIYQKDNKFYLEVLRTKAKTYDTIQNVSKQEDYYREDTVRIDESLFELIQLYQDILTKEFGYKEKEFLFPYDLIKPYANHKFVKRTLNANKITTRDLLVCIDKFYSKVISDEYKFKTIPRYAKKKIDGQYIELMNGRDLRHIAIINLVLMGCDVLDTMHLAGHTSVNTAFGYYNHVKEFSKGYALGYIKTLKHKEQIKSEAINNDNETICDIGKKHRKEEFNQIMNILNGNNKTNTIKVDGGYCNYTSVGTDKSICLHYEGNHKICNYFVPEDKMILQKELEKIENKIDSRVRIIKDLIGDMDKISKFNELYKTQSFELSKDIRDIAFLYKKILQEA
ncbi:site-specific integrase [Paeniclostridium sordellii]|uniref:site-specific integrase n=1 Tax=Paraclostridium sordellii TaxID=1505 RepID=UPI002149E876|nr:site-specific integrase [Paeniclostridium sordellii]MCR1848831.1 site-specific integrase [Paeniclostridium sordellii]